MPLPMVLNICQFKRNGEMEYGEFQELSNGEGVCMIPSVDDPEEVVFVRDAAGHVPDGITDFMLTPVPCSINDVHDGHLEMIPAREHRLSSRLAVHPRIQPHHRRRPRARRRPLA